MVKSFTRFALIPFLSCFFFIVFSGHSYAQSKKSGGKKSSARNQASTTLSPANQQPAVAAPAAVEGTKFYTMLAFCSPDVIKPLMEDYQTRDAAVKWMEYPGLQEVFIILFEKGPESAKAMQAAYPEQTFIPADQVYRLCEVFKCGMDLSALKEYL